VKLTCAARQQPLPALEPGLTRLRFPVSAPLFRSRLHHVLAPRSQNRRSVKLTCAARQQPLPALEPGL